MYLFHGTNAISAQSILRSGIVLSDERKVNDFSISGAFYVTPDPSVVYGYIVDSTENVVLIYVVNKTNFFDKAKQLGGGLFDFKNLPNNITYNQTTYMANERRFHEKLFNDLVSLCRSEGLDVKYDHLLDYVRGQYKNKLYSCIRGPLGAGSNNNPNGFKFVPDRIDLYLESSIDMDQARNRFVSSTRNSEHSSKRVCNSLFYLNFQNLNQIAFLRV